MSIFGTIGNFLFGNGGKKHDKSKVQSNSTTTQAPYAPVTPAVNDYISQIGSTFNGGAPQISPMEQQGYSTLGNIAGTPSPQSTAALTENNKTVSGEYLTPETNPYLADIAKRVGGGAMAAVNATYGGAGRTGSGLALQAAGTGVGNALTDFFGGQYNQERQYQQNAVQMSPQLEASRYLAPQALIGAGQQVSARPFDIAAQYGGILGNIARLGGTTTSAGTTLANGTSAPASNGWLVNKLFPTG